MKQIAVILFAVILIPSILAIEMNIKTNYNSGETLIVKISGDFAEKISSDDISFYRKHIEIPMEFELEKIESDYYLYAVLPQTEELTNYSIELKSKIMNVTKILDIELKKEFAISQETAIFNVKPGFVKTNSDFSLTLQNLINNDTFVNVNLGEEKGFLSSLFDSDKKESITLKPKETKKIYFEIDDFEESHSTITLTSNNTQYDILIFIPSVSEKDEQEDNPNNNIAISPELKQEAKKKKVDVYDLKRCKESGGTVCTGNEKCDGTEEIKEDALCCFGNCTKENSSLTRILGGIILIAIILIVIFLFAKYKSTRRNFNILDAARGR